MNKQHSTPKKRSPRTFERGKAYAVHCLSKKMHTKKELYDKLYSKDYPDEICVKIIEYLEELSYIDDQDYAERYAKDAHNLKKIGVMRIKRELVGKGIDIEIINNLFDELDLDFEKSLASIIDIKSQRSDLTDYKEKRRLIAHLMRRGYTYSEISAVLSKKENEID